MGIDLLDAFVVPRLFPGRCRFDIAHLPLVEGLHPSTSTAPANMIYALHESLRLVLEAGLDARYERHRDNAGALWKGLERLGITLPVNSSVRLPPLTLAGIPEGADDRTVRAQLLDNHGLEIGGGLGEFAGKAWRIGLMGASSTPRHVELCLSALGEALA